METTHCADELIARLQANVSLLASGLDDALARITALEAEADDLRQDKVTKWNLPKISHNPRPVF
jgi:hypothetical protein